MSRIGQSPIQIPEGVTVTHEKDIFSVKGPLGELSQKVDPVISVKVEEGRIVLTRATELKAHKSLHGLYRSLINNMVIGVTKGYTIKQELVGVGFRAAVKGQILEMNLGFSHDVYIEMPPEIKVEAKTERRSNPVLTLTSIDKQLLGQVAAKLRSLRKPEPYKGKGIKFVGERLRRKAGKAASI